MEFVVQVLGDTGTTRSVKSDGVDLVKESQRAVTLRQVAYLLDGSNATTHRINTFEGYDLRCLFRVLRELHLEVLQIVVFEDDSLSARVTHALDHGRVVHVV